MLHITTSTQPSASPIEYSFWYNLLSMPMHVHCMNLHCGCIHMNYFAKDYGLSTSHSCCKCPADIHNHPYTHITPAASWVNRCYTEREFRRAFPDCCEVFDLPGVSHHTVGPDTMHNKHLGMDPYFCSSVLYLLVYTMMPGMWAPTPEAISNRCKGCIYIYIYIERDIQRWCAKVYACIYIGIYEIVST